MISDRKRLVCILTAVMVFLLAIPAFASSDGASADPGTAGAAVQAEQPGQAEQAGQGGSPEKSEQEDMQKQTEGSAEAGEAIRNGDEGAADSERTEQAEDGVEGDPEEAKAEKPEADVPVVKKPMAAAAKESTALPENNTKVSYTSAGSHPVKFTVKTGGYTFKGTCATLGVDNAKSGKATVKRISNNSKIAKLVYYYGYKKGWWQGKNSSKKATTVMGFTDKNCTENAKQCIEALIQRDNMGWDKFWAARKVGKYRMYSTDSFMKEINDVYKNTDVSKISIPDDVIFEMFHGETSSSGQQDFYVWRYKTKPLTHNGFVAVEKVSGDVSIID